MKENLGSSSSDPWRIDGFSKPMERSGPILADRFLSVLANEYRWTILQGLIKASDQTLEFDTLVDFVAENLRSDDVTRESDDYRQRIRIALHHNHLPTLEEIRIINYDTDTGYVKFVGDDLEQDIRTLIGLHDSDELTS